MLTRTKLKQKDIYKHDIDGNTFIKAIKNIDGWKIDMIYSELRDFMKRFLDICGKLNKKYDTILLVPSTYNINKRLGNILKVFVGTDKIIEDCFEKRDKIEVYNSLNVNKIFDNYNEFTAKQIMNEIRYAFRNKMKDYFEAKYVKQYLSHFNSYITSNNSKIDEIYNDIEK